MILPIPAKILSPPISNSLLNFKAQPEALVMYGSPALLSPDISNQLFLGKLNVSASFIQIYTVRIKKVTCDKILAPIIVGILGNTTLKIRQL